MKPISGFSPENIGPIRVVLCDIDDTLTWRGRLPGVAYCALENLSKAGLIVVPVTGRPAGWCDHIARMWPVDGIVGENGAFYFHYDETLRKMRRKYWRSDIERLGDKEALNAIEQRVLQDIPQAAVSADQAYREADLAIDFCEDVPPLDPADIARIVDVFEAAGAVAKVSSIHVNGWFGEYDKLSMTRQMLREVWSIDIDATPEQVCFVGDSPNDAPMFGFFEHTIGVANISGFADQLPAAPQWITEAPGGFGFAEFAELLLQSRS